jgi:phosphoenolpyruvate carboxykinase (ATP)
VYPGSRDTNYDDTTITPSARLGFPLRYVKNAKIPAKTGLPKNVIFLANDTFGVLPPVAKLTWEQACYHFLNGYSPGIIAEKGTKIADLRFRACFGERFLAYHPTKYL